MIIRLSHSMLKKLKLTVTTTAEPTVHPLCDWAVRLFRWQRLQYILATNTTSLFCVTWYGSGITSEKSFRRQFLSALEEHHAHVGLTEAFETIVVPDSDDVLWSKVGNRSVTGSMNEFIFYAQDFADRAHVAGYVPTPLQISQELNRTIMSPIAYRTPLEVHQAIAQTKPH